MVARPFLSQVPASRMMSERFTGHSEGHQGSDLPLEAVGGDAGVVSGVAAGDFGEVELAVPLLHARRQLSSVCRGRQRDAQGQRGVRRAGPSGACGIQVVKWTPSWQKQTKRGG